MNLSQTLFRNFGTKLLALAIACVAWYLLTGERRERISERSYRIPLSIVNIPRGFRAGTAIDGAPAVSRLMSVPPPMHQPWTAASVGFEAYQSFM